MYSSISRFILPLLLSALVIFSGSVARATTASVTAGKPVTLAVSANGAAPMVYKWYKDGTLLSGAVNATYVIGSFQSANAGVYSSVVTNPLGSTTSDNATLALAAGATAPAITTQPASKTANAGTAVTFSAAASGSPTPTYQWRKDGSNISGATNASYTIASVAAGNAGSYTMVATNSAGSATSTGATLTVNTAPVFTTQPLSQVITLGGSVLFSATASGSPTPTYQWRKDGVNISGAVSASLSLSLLQLLSAGTYTVVASNSVGSVTSSGALLTINLLSVAPSITTQPASQTVTAGAAVTFTAAASGSPTPTYQWRKNGTNISGATSASYAMTSVSSANAGTYTFVATNSAGSATSSGAVLTVNSANTAPTISGIAGQTTATATAVGPVSFTVGDLETAPTSLVVSAASSNGTLLPISGVAFGGSGANRTITLTPATGQTGTATVTVTVTDGALTAASSFVLTVTSSSGTRTFANTTPITILDAAAASLYPAPITVSGMSGTISTVTVSLNGFNHTWPRDVDVLLVGPAGQKVLLMSDAGTDATVNATLTFADAAPATLTATGIFSSGSYKPTNYETAADAFPAPAPAGPYASTLAAFAGQSANGTWSLYVVDDGAKDAGTITGGWSLTITTTGGASAAPTISDIVSQATTTGISTGAISFTVADADTLATSLTLSGSSDNATLVPNANIAFGGSGANRTVTVTPVAGQTGTATISVGVSDGTSTTLDTFVLTVNAATVAPAFTVQPSSQTVTAGAAVTFSAAANGNPSPTYQWRKDGAAISGATSASYALASATSANAGTYTVVATNSAGSATSAGAVLTVNPLTIAPVITTQPASQTATAGGSVTFTAAATGTPAPAYQWRLNGTNISGATSASYTIGAVTAGNAGTYTMVATNSAGSVTSAGAVLTVNPLAVMPVITTQPAGQTIATGASVTFTAAASGLPAPTYQWRKNGTAIAGATNASYTDVSVVAGDAGTYTLVATNSAGSATSNGAVLTVNSAPVITTQPASQTIATGANVTFVAAAGGTPTPTYQWKKNGTSISGATSSSYTITNVASGSAGTYTLVATNSAGSATSNGAVLTVNSAPVITTQPASQTIAKGGTVNFQVVASGAATLTYQWKKNGTAISGAKSASYSIANLASTNAATYTVVVSNSSGSVTSAGAVLTVSTGPSPVVTRVDFNGDGKSDILWQNSLTGECNSWSMNGTTFLGGIIFGTYSTDWQPTGTGDFNGDNQSDILWQNNVTGERSIWLMSAGVATSKVSLGVVATDWQMSGSGDFNGDGKSDLLWQNKATGERVIWLMAGTSMTSSVSLGLTSTDWQISGAGDFNKDGQSDILVQNIKTGECVVWLMNGTTFSSKVSICTVPTQLQLCGTGDFNGDGQSDILVQNILTGQARVWFMTGTKISDDTSLGYMTTEWIIRN